MPHAWYRHQIVPPALAAFALDAPLLVSLTGRTELRREPPVRAKANEPGGFFPLMAAQDLLHGTLKVVIAQDTEHPRKEGKCQLMRFQKRLLGGVRIGPVKSPAAGHAAHAEHVHLAGHTIKLHPALIPIHLRLNTQQVGLRNTDLRTKKADARLAEAYIPSDRRSRDVHFWHLAPHPHPDPMRRVTLFSGRLAVGFQDRVDKWNRWRKLRMLAFRHLPCRRYRAGKRLAYLPPVHPQLPRHLPDGSGTVFVLPPDLFVKFHLGSPVLQFVHPSGRRSPIQDTRLVGYRWGQFRRAKGANSEGGSHLLFFCVT